MTNRIATLAFFSFAAVAASWAQVRVTVVDPSGARIPSATVELRSASGQLIEQSRTSASGVAELAGSAPSVLVRADGFRSAAVDLAGQSSAIVWLEVETGSVTMEVISTLPAAGAVATEHIGSPEVAKRDLVESLRESPSVHVLRRGGTNFEPVVQGLRETQIAMVFDDTRTFAAGPARMDSELSHVAPGTTASVRVVTGPYALTEGAGAMAAIVVHSDPIPREAAWRLRGRGGMAWESNGAGRLGHARLDAGGPALGLRISASGSLQDDYRAGAGPGPGLVPADAASHQFGARLRFNPDEAQEISATARYNEQTGVDFPGRLLTAEHFILRGWSGTYRLERSKGLIQGLKLTAYLNRKSHRMSNRDKPTAMDMPGRMPPFALDISLPTESDTAGLAGRLFLSPARGWRVMTGFDHFDLRQDAQRFISRARDRRLLFSDAVWAGTTQRNTGLYAQAERAFNGGGVWAAVRLDMERAEAGRPTAFYRSNAASGDLAVSRASPSLGVAARRELAPGLTLAGGFGRVARMPSALERYSDRFPSTRFQVAAEFMGNPGIRPETSMQGDVALQWSVGRLRLDAGGFVRALEDYITIEPDPSLPKRLPLSPPVVFRYVNGESALFRGWNARARWIAEGIEIDLRASKILADDRQRNEPVLGIAPLEADGSVRYFPGGRRFWAEFGTRRVWGQHRVAAARLETPSPAFILHRARLGATLGNSAILHFGITNLGDARYAEHINSLNPFTRQRIPEMGRTVTAGLTVTW